MGMTISRCAPKSLCCRGSLASVKFYDSNRHTNLIRIPSPLCSRYEVSALASVGQGSWQLQHVESLVLLVAELRPEDRRLLFRPISSIHPNSQQSTMSSEDDIGDIIPGVDRSPVEPAKRRKVAR